MATNYLRGDTSGNLSWVASTNIDLTGGKAALAINSSTDVLYWVKSATVPISSDPVYILTCESSTDVPSWVIHTSFTFST